MSVIRFGIRNAIRFGLVCILAVLTVLVSATSALAHQAHQNDGDLQLAPPLPSLNQYQGHRLAEQCAWAPNDRSVCRARTTCTTDLYGDTCAKYCTVNPDDVICGDAYRQILPHVDPWTDDSPYPWARSGGTFCHRNAWSIHCLYRQGRYDRF
jgi:hypothetical protein